MKFVKLDVWEMSPDDMFPEHVTSHPKRKLPHNRFSEIELNDGMRKGDIIDFNCIHYATLLPKKLKYDFRL